MSDPYADIIERLDADHITEAARHAAFALRSVGYARVELTPGDMTRYRIVVVAPGPCWSKQRDINSQEYDVSLQGARSYPWLADTGYVSPDYAAEKWTVDHQTHTGVVISLFLNALSEALA